MSEIFIDIETIKSNESQEVLDIISSGIDLAASNVKDKQLSIEKALEKIYSSLSLSPVTARIACIGYKVDYDEPECICYDSERDILLEFQKVLDQVFTYEPTEYDIKRFYKNKIITFNGKKFDLPFIQYRSIVNNVSIMNLNDKYPANYIVVDLFDYLTNISLTDNLHSKLSMVSLSKWASIFGIGEKQSISKKEIDIEQLFYNDRGKLIEYSLNDVMLIYKLYKKIGVL